jgi:hypothetical protein
MEDKIYSIIKVFTTNSKYDEYYISDHKREPVQPDNLIINKMF